MSSIRGVNVGGNLFDVTDSSNVAPIQLTNFASRPYAKDRCFIMADGLLYRATAEIESGDPIVINGNCRRTTLDEIISVIETDSDLIAPTEDGATSSDDYEIGDEIVRSGILYNVISAIAEDDAFVIGNNIDIAGSLTSQIKTLANNDDAMLNVLGAKNLLSVKATTQVVDGRTFTVNPDKTVTVTKTGTPENNNAIIYLNQDNFVVPCDCILSGRPITSESPAGSTIAILRIKLLGETGYRDDLGEGVLIPKGATVDYSALIVGKNAESSITFEPMLRPAKIQDKTHTPYTMTNEELTNHVDPVDMSSYFAFGTNEGKFDLETNQVPVEFWKIGRIAILSMYFKCTETGRVIGTISNSDVLPSKLFVAPCASNDGTKECSVIIHSNGTIYSDFNIDVGQRYALNAMWLTRA